MSWFSELSTTNKSLTVLSATAAGGFLLGATASGFASGIFDAPSDIAVLKSELAGLKESIETLNSKDFILAGDSIALELFADRNYYFRANKNDNSFRLRVMSRTDQLENGHMTWVVRRPPQID